jgi:hypothetical protein
MNPSSYFTFDSKLKDKNNLLLILEFLDDNLVQYKSILSLL